ncbi:MAG TPA: ABC transporter ATP-binding protein [Syntrophorhabdaceae bacterium]|nr:ABC transporter ATP-binding protein [Syntrophorhabdaceae bacterium]HOT42006.1 ABC transporter ATP-binding protein [Syntrophorhabdaceae bacterium]HPC66545.1 ABC transporter ATP-binding protein [Syntrophorhabdaceae bacterium]HQE81247.1 ABC transporter ATP-binding protein [Syntrophorhabdaceae bacterium]HQH43116.1 ABC transporter ATP-binding protein [Syntrophorhabdaceae bacterium]
MAILEIRNLTKSFGGIKAVDDVSVDVHENTLLGIIGPNGSGKTTFVNMITGFIRPDKGSVRFKGKELIGLTPYKITNMGIGRAFQMVKPFFHLPAFKNIIVPLSSDRVRATKGGGFGDKDAIALDILEEVGFERDSSVPYKTASVLPHGYLKRLELARLIALKAEVLILDELFSGLSIAEVTSIVPIIEKLLVEGKTIIMIEHRLKELFRIADNVIVFNFGKKIKEGKPKEILEDEEVKKAYLGVEV